MTSRPFLQGEQTTFDKVFPSIKSLTLIGKEHGDFRAFPSIPIEHRSTRHYTASNLPARISCSNPMCQQGGYELQWILDSIVKSRDIHYENTFFCFGHEGSPKGGRKGDPCCNYIEITIDLNYKEETNI